LRHNHRAGGEGKYNNQDREKGRRQTGMGRETMRETARGVVEERGERAVCDRT
jgi:hypothetical protein